MKLLEIEVKTVAKVISEGPMEMWAILDYSGSGVEALFPTEEAAEEGRDCQDYGANEYALVAVMITASTVKTIK